MDSDDERLSQGFEEEDEGEELINERMSQDYRAIDDLDRFESEGLDEEFEDDASIEERAAQRRAADAALDRRDAGVGRRRGRMPFALDEDSDSEGRPNRRRRMADEDLADEDDEGPLAFDITAHSGPLAEWLADARVQPGVKLRFRKFLKTYKDPGSESKKYVDLIHDMVAENTESFEVSFPDLGNFHATLASWLADVPGTMLELLHEAASEVVREMYPDYLVDDADRVFVRISNLSVHDHLRDLRTAHLNVMIRVSGVVTRRSGVFPQMKVVRYDCMKCGYVLGPFVQSGEGEVRPNACPQCQSKGPFQVNSAETVYGNYQKLTLQESPGSVPAGRLPRHKEVVLLGDLIDAARPGEEIEVTGVYVSSYDASLNVKNSFPVFTTLIEANHIQKREAMFAALKLTDDDRKEVLALAADPRIGQRIIKSIAPSIYGHETIKTALALALFGGQAKAPTGSHRLRGDINVLLLGDPGVAKSQFLKYAEKTAPRAVFTTGKGASAVGLTAGVHKDPITREWTLEGGALVLADKGVCLIDEFDKMNDQDRVSIHEAMEQQSISISKAGIVTQLQARCAVLAAANPIGGRYDPSRTFAENVELSDPILSRFDILCVVRDTVDPVQDRRLAEFVVASHMRSHPGTPGEEGAIGNGVSGDADTAAADEDPDVLPQELLRRYLMYAKAHCRPAMQRADYERVASVYAKLREEAARTRGMPMAVRHLESMIRMAEAHARMHLRDYVSEDDINVSIGMMVESFISSQKYSVHRALRQRFRRYLVSASDYHSLALHLLRQLLREEQRSAQIAAQGAASDDEDAGGSLRISVKALEDRAREYNLDDLQAFYESQLFSVNGFALEGEHIVYLR